MFKDDARHHFTQSLQQKDLKAFAHLLTFEIIVKAALASGLAITSSPLCLPNLIWLAVAAALFPHKSFGNLVPDILRVLEKDPRFAARPQDTSARKSHQKIANHSPHRDASVLPTEEAFVQARQRLPLVFWLHLFLILGESFHQQHGPRTSFKGYRILACDGTHLELDRHPQLVKHFGHAKNGKPYKSLLARMVMLQFPLTRVPFHYEVTSQAEGEITVARRLVKRLDANDLVLCDAGFWSYGLFWDIKNRDAFFAIRLTQRAKFKTLHVLSRQEKLVRWTPHPGNGLWKDLPKSMELRLLSYRVPGFRKQTIVTNLLDPKVNHEDWTRLSWQYDGEGRLLPAVAGLYWRRWEIETTFRELKVVQGLEGGLRSRTVASLQYEIAGHVLLYLLVRWLMAEAAQRHGLEPLQISFTAALRILHEFRVHLILATPAWVKILLQDLLEEIADHLVTVRPGRRYRRRKKSTNHRRKAKAAKASATSGKPV